MRWTASPPSYAVLTRRGPDLTPQGEGLLAISYGLSANFPDDHEMLKHGLVMYDALYTWCRMQVEAKGAH